VGGGLRIGLHLREPEVNRPEMKLLLRVVRSVALVYVALVLLFAGCQNRMLYFPSHAKEEALLAEAHGAGNAPWRDGRGALIGWKAGKPNGARRMVVFHGNAGYALQRMYYAEGLESMDWEVYLFEYPGYGAREGTPGKEAFLAAGRAAVGELLAADSRPLYLLGESIGSGTACSLAAESPQHIAGLLLVVPFARLVEVAKKHFPFLPVERLLHDRYDNIASLAKYRGPVAIVLAENDDVIPAEQARKLHAAYAGPKHLIALPGAGHNDFPNDRTELWWREVGAFFERGR